jgi:hypothetical protein
MRFTAAWVLITSTVAVSGAQAQLTLPSRFSVGGDLTLSQPKSEFAENVGNGYGFDFTGLFSLDPKGFFNIRGDLGGVQYGRETKHLTSQFTGRIRYNLETDNRIEFGSIGVQLQNPDGWFRPYANAAIALTGFTTQSTLSDDNNTFEPLSNTNSNDMSHAWIFGGGVKIPFSRFSSGALNFGARYFYGGEAQYLTRGDIVDQPDGSVVLNFRNSKTDLVLWQLGASFTIPRSTGH